MTHNTSMDTSQSSQTHSQKLINFSKPTPDFNRKFYDLFSQKAMVDVTLSADGQFLQAHKVVLAVASSWFEELFAMLKDKHPVIVLHNLTLQQLSSVLEFIYLGAVAIPEEDSSAFKSSLEALRISLADLSQQEQEEQEEAEAEEVDQTCEDDEDGEDEEEDDVENEEEEDVEVEETENSQETPEDEENESKPPEIKKEPEWEEEQEEIQMTSVKEEPQDPAPIVKESPLRMTEVTHVPPKLASAVSSGSIRIRTPASINERVRVSEPPAFSQQQQQRFVKIVQKIPTVIPAPTNIQELSKRLSKAILIRRVKKSDGSFVSERSPVQIIQGVKIQKVKQQQQHQQQQHPHFVPVRPQARPPPRVVMMQQQQQQPSEKRMMPIFRCSHCSKAFSVNKRRNAHEKYCFKNPSRPSSQCPYCPMVLCNPMYISTHIKKVHGIDDGNARDDLDDTP